MLELAGAREQRREPRVLRRDAVQLEVQGVELVARREHAPVRLQGPLEHGAVEALGGFLRQMASARPLGGDAGAGLRRELAEQHAQQRSLAGAVRADQRHAVAGRDHPIDAVEQHALADRVAKILDLDQRRAVTKPTSSVPVRNTRLRAARGSGPRAPSRRTGRPCAPVHRRTTPRRRRIRAAGSAPGPSGSATGCRCRRWHRPGQG